MLRATTPRGRCLEGLRDARVATIRELAARTGLSRPTVEALIGDFEAEGLVDTDVTPAPPSSGGGRPARRYRFRAERHHVVGLDLSDVRQRVAIANLAGDIVHTDLDGPASPRTGTADLTALRDHVARAFEAARLPLRTLAGLTVAVPGIVGGDGRLSHSPAVREWQDVDMASRLTELFGCPVTVENDLVLAAGAEATLGASQFADTSLYLLTWFHVSARLVIGGRVHVGRHHQAGELLALRVLAGPVRGDEGPWTHVEAADARLAAGGPDGLQLAEELTDRMALAVGGLLAAVDPDLVVLGGRLGRYADLLVPMLRPKVAAQLNLSFEYPIVGHALGELDVSLGGVLRSFDTVGAALLRSPDVSTPAISPRPVPSPERTHA
ncbi:Sugar kinase of the NBD/HSP70 family, may contain an N-terminal HTH domain [Actinokineospora alba]|uniref:Sugar kinase of the NBD/HSP70 family, may contain an N-terminal HTH domain n=1 Tax=Actinokineospora alba TaxID=504798 RepID=A0A1H0F8L8_9PSEU|nr:ROK family transcriptional regulator [Actinokineospora alba]TDP69387.1 putative NBD/HSP70 family sugar kinase [Actinokineospora alba]SDI17787.1 Sugar kinase of the NBD/HSP70 family, may contain an N-terminal HTH domain [Actinokineospora alba]SDN91047.1 Sugar kinase of the NBD/HSP70 family, may contain an N-terminal HTH domain [Actinokineospora alba]